MVKIMCCATLHQALVSRGVPTRSGAPVASVRLGDWAATLAGGKLVVAIEERTCLTLVLPLRPIAGFRSRFVAALRRALADYSVSPHAAEPECRAVHDASFVRRRHPNLVADLDFARIEALAHVDGGQGRESVRDMLNEYPYKGCPASCPMEAVNLLFASRIASDRGQKEAARCLSSPATRR